MNVLVWSIVSVVAFVLICAVNALLNWRLRKNTVWVITCPQTTTLALVEVVCRIGLLFTAGAACGSSTAPLNGSFKAAGKIACHKLKLRKAAY